MLQITNLYYPPPGDSDPAQPASVEHLTEQLTEFRDANPTLFPLPEPLAVALIYKAQGPPVPVDEYPAWPSLDYFDDYLCRVIQCLRDAQIITALPEKFNLSRSWAFPGTEPGVTVTLEPAYPRVAAISTPENRLAAANTFTRARTFTVTLGKSL